MTAPYDEKNLEESAANGLSRNKAEGLSPGEILREARLSHDYTVRDLCAQTKLSSRTVNALEDNDFQALSQPVFARGYYRQCAKVLDIDADRIARAYAAWAGEPEKTTPASPRYVNVVPQDVTPSRSRVGRLLLLLLVVLVIVGGALFFLSNGMLGSDNTGDTDTVATNDAPADDTFASSQDTTADSMADTSPGGPDGVSDDTGAASSGNGANTQNVEPRTGQTTGGRNVNQSLGITPPGDEDTGDATPAAGEQSGSGNTAGVPANRLTLIFVKRSWVRVTDANGNRLASGIFEAGQSKTFDSEAPYQVRLGFAPGVKVTIGGRSVDVAAQSSGSSVATLNVPAADSGAAPTTNDQ